MEKSYTEMLDISGRMQRHPYQTLLVAVGVGYVLGGGLFSRLTLNVLRVGARIATLPIVQREVLGIAGAVLGARTNASS